MRSIKFRAVKKGGVYLYDLYAKDDCLYRYEEDYDGFSSIISLIPLDSKEYKFEQYVGFYDKKGKEIWEGDIVKFSDWYKPKVVVWNNGRFHLKDTLVLCCDFECDEMEVIGNNHENPELLY